MAASGSGQSGGSFSGVSLASFLQMLEQEKKSCTLAVTSGSDEGFFFFEDGELVDAEFGSDVGEKAAYALLVVDNPAFRVSDAEDRMQRIKAPLAHLLLNAATRKDEEDDSGESSAVTVGESILNENPAIQNLLSTIIAFPGVHHYFLLNRQGKMIAQSSKNRKIADFITYSIVGGIQIRKALEAKGPHRIRIDLDNGEMLLIIPGAGMIIGLLMDENASISEVTSALRVAMAKR